MNGFHIMDSSPKVRLGEEFRITDFDLLCQILSALSWKKTNGDIYLVCDEVALNALGDGVKVYDKVFILDDMSEIDNIAFWAGGKIYALSKQKAPCAMIDTDFIVWDKLDLGEGITVAHREEISPMIYPDKNAFIVKNYKFNPLWSWDTLPCNTAFAYFSDEDFKNYYTECSKEFMKACCECDNVLTYMVFAEQRLLSMCAEEKGVKINSLMDYTALGEDKRFTHLWGYKQILREDDEEREAFCRRCADRIKRDFPECVQILKEIEIVKKYFI